MSVFQRFRSHTVVTAPPQTVPRHLDQHVAQRVDRQQVSFGDEIRKRKRLQRLTVQLEAGDFSLALNTHDRCLFPLHQLTGVDSSFKRQWLKLYGAGIRQKLRTASDSASPEQKCELVVGAEREELRAGSEGEILERNGRLARQRGLRDRRHLTAVRDHQKPVVDEQEMLNHAAGAAAAEEEGVLAGGDGDRPENSSRVGDESASVQEEEERGVEGETGDWQRGDVEGDRCHGAVGKGGEGEALFVCDDDVLGPTVSAKEKTVAGGSDRVGAEWSHGAFFLLPVDLEDGAGLGPEGIERAEKRKDVGSAVHSAQSHVIKESGLTGVMNRTQQCLRSVEDDRINDERGHEGAWRKDEGKDLPTRIS